LAQDLQGFHSSGFRVILKPPIKMQLKHLFLLTLLAVGSESATPAQKVIELLDKLSTVLTKEAQTEKEQFAKYAAFCASTTDEKAYKISQNNKTIAALSAKLDKLVQDAKGLNSEKDQLSATIADIKKQRKDTNDARKSEVAAYKLSAQDMDGAISALNRAIETLETSQSTVKGTASLLQLPEYASQVLDAAGRLSQLQISIEEIEALNDIVQKPGEAPKFQFKSGDVIAMLKGLLSTFKSNKQTLDVAEAKSKGNFDQKITNIEKEWKFAKRDMEGVSKTIADKVQQAGQTKTSLTEASNALQADVKFLAALKDDCAIKAKAAVQRSEARTQELSALKQATEALKKGGIAAIQEQESPANQEASLRPISRVDLPEASESETFVQEPVDEASAFPSFIQLRGTAKRMLRKRSVSSEALDNLSEMLADEASNLNSPELTLLSLRVQSNGDNFVEIRKIILSLMNDLRNQSATEANTKAFCDTELQKSVKAQNEGQAYIEKQQAFIESSKAQAKQLAGDIAALNKAINDTQAELLQATVMRANESATNNVTRKDANAGMKSVKYAIEALKKFYSPASAFFQMEVESSDDQPIDPAAPKVDVSSYSGNQARSNGVLAMLDVLLSDFAKTIKATKEAEAKAVADFEKLQKDAQAEMSSNKDAIAAKTAQLKDTSEKLTLAQEDVTVKQKELNLTNDAVKKLKGMCSNEDNYEDRKQKRQQEIESLTKSLKMIDELLAQQ
jgi:hypothetical protein